MFDNNLNAKFIFDNNNSMSYVQDKVCPKCGISLSEVQRNGVVGCANCYIVFENEIKSMIFNQQGTVNHSGKISSKRFLQLKLRDKIAKLEQEKEEAVKNENFPAAEALKNQIEKLKGELQ